jgi:hypothetical protein
MLSVPRVFQEVQPKHSKVQSKHLIRLIKLGERPDQPRDRPRFAERVHRRPVASQEHYLTYILTSAGSSATVCRGSRSMNWSGSRGAPSIGSRTAHSGRCGKSTALLSSKRRETKGGQSRGAHSARSDFPVAPCRIAHLGRPRVRNISRLSSLLSARVLRRLESLEAAPGCGRPHRSTRAVTEVGRQNNQGRLCAL